MSIREWFLILGVTLIGIPLLRRYAFRLNLVDLPNRRSIHTTPTPRGGGVVFVVAALADLVIFHPSFAIVHSAEIAALMTILGIGILDDRHEAAPRTKFLVIALATLILWMAGLSIDQVGRYFGVEIRFAWLALPFTFFAVAGFTNAFNLIDGIDGLAGTMALVILGAFAWLGWRYGDNVLLLFSLAFMAGVLGFLLFNRPPATIFMGDSGSLTLGFLIAMLSIHALRWLPSVSILYLGAVPILDTLVAMFRRKMAGRSATAPDRCHFHHLLLHVTGSVPRTVMLLALIQILLILVAFTLQRGTDQTLPFLFFFILLYGAYRWIVGLIERKGIDCYGGRSASPPERDTPVQ